MLDQNADAESLLVELSDGWRRMRTIASAEWVSAAGHAAARIGPEAAELLRDALGDAPHHTAWSRAAIASLDGTMAAGRGDYTGAAMSYLDAADRYARVGSETDRILALGGAVRVLSTAATEQQRSARELADPRATAAQDEVAQFAGRNGIIAPL